MYGVPAEIYRDHRYLDIGDLPTGFGPYRQHGFSKLYARPFVVRELSLLYAGSQSVSGTGLSHIVRAVDMAISCDASVLTDGDFEYVMAWLRLNSYPKAPSLVTWTCKKVNIVNIKDRAFQPDPSLFLLDDDRLRVRGMKHEVCDTENNEIVHNSDTIIHTLDDGDIVVAYDDLDFPRVATLVELSELVEEHPELRYEASIARWIKDGDTLKDKMRILNDAPNLDQFTRIQECTQRYKHGISETMGLRCRVCGNKLTHTARPDPTTFFADNSEQNILDMQYTLLSKFGLQPDDNMPAKTLLYHHSCYAKDRQAEQERINLAKAMSR